MFENGRRDDERSKTKDGTRLTIFATSRLASFVLYFGS